MKHLGVLVAGVSLLLAPYASAQVTTIFWDDMEDETHNEDNPIALIGTWGSENDDDGRAIEYAQEGIPAPPGGGQYGMKISRRYSASTYAKAATVATGNGGKVHAEWDWYITANGNDYSVFGLTANEDFASPPHRPDAGWVPNIGYRGPDGNAPDMQNLYNDQGPWIDLGTTPAIPKPAQGQWHKIEFDYTLGDDTSMTLTVNGVSANIPGPWGWDALGNVDHPDSRGVVEEIMGAIWYNNGGANFLTEQYVDNVLITFDIKGASVASFDVREARLLEFQSDSSGGLYNLQYALPPATSVWMDTGLTIQGTGGPLFTFDPAETNGSSTGKIYRALFDLPAP